MENILFCLVNGMQCAVPDKEEGFNILFLCIGNTTEILKNKPQLMSLSEDLMPPAGYS